MNRIINLIHENIFLKLKENQTIELKQSTNGLPSSIFETYSSFANTKGGKIYLGIKEGKEPNNIIGVNNPSALKKDFLQYDFQQDKSIVLPWWGRVMETN